MKKILILLIFVFILSGCVTYKFQKSTSFGNQGYLACYGDKPILEYTAGKEKSLPDLVLAKERFKRRRPTVEYYYKKMGSIESRLKEFFWDPPAMLVDLLGGVLRWPFIAVADYKYNRNPKYKERMDRLEEEKEELEKVRVNALKEKLNLYINEDLAKEFLLPNIAVVAPFEPSLQEEAVSVVNQPSAPTPVLESVTSSVVSSPPQTQIVAVEQIKEPVIVQQPLEAEPIVLEEKPLAKPVLAPPVAIIIAKPVKGYSPLKVIFSSKKSYSKSGKIVAYDWDFGDGDISDKKNPENTYWSTTYGSRNFTVTLKVRDDAGNASSASTIIEVITK